MKTNPDDSIGLGVISHQDCEGYDEFEPSYHLGLTKREYFAAMVMQGIISRTGERIETQKDPELAVKLADALIAELNK